MVSDQDSSSSILSEPERKQEKLHKKLKKKLEKKHKKKKKKKDRIEKKRSHKSTSKCSSEDKFGQTQKPSTSTLMMSVENASNNKQADTFGPALPPHLLNKNKEIENNKPSVIGPVFPEGILKQLEQSKSQNLQDGTISQDLPHNYGNSESLQGSYGPLPLNNETEMTQAQVELEHRALQLKMAAMDGINAPTVNQNVREDWMLELPAVGLKSGIAALNNLKRGFHQGKEKPDFSDRSSWTKTPNSDADKQKPTSSKEELVIQAQVLFEKQRDAEQEAIAKKHKKKHKREESLVEIHQKKLRKEERKKAKELQAMGAKPERRPFTRDVDLKLNKIDRNQTKQIVDKAKILNTKFSSGCSKYL